MKKNWYAVYTKIGNETKAAALLSRKKFENYCPNNRFEQPNKGYKRKMDFEPLFPTFVFVYISEVELSLIKKTNFIIDFVYWLGEPAVIREAEINNIKQFTEQHYNITIEKSTVNTGGTVRIINDLNADSRAANTFVNSTLKLQLPSLGFTMIAQLTKQPADTFSYQLETNKSVF